MIELIEVLLILEKQIEKVIKTSESAVLEIVQSVENSMTVLKNSKDLIASSMLEVLELNRKSIAAINEVVEENARVLQEVEDYIRQLVTKINDVFQLWDKEEQAALVEILEKINRKTRVVALNASIEAARLGAAGRNFAVVAKEIQGLVSQTSEAIGNLAEHNKTFKGKVEELSGSLEELENYFLSQLRAANEKIKESGKISREWGQKVSDIFSKADTALKDLEEVISRGVINFQFQDIIAQRLNNVIQGLRVIEEHLEGKEQGELLSKIKALYNSEEERRIHQSTLDAELLNVEFF
ncbi:methyl-accepting chemotaxis protein [Carboxydothermus islandicus]|uniref:Methyl-accepting chemotaxis protein n=1 Tax=Carboxydothermus islandicus TaxID=661089 RepID=A0A1L8D559_9THEO|nr:methyl-accepting chemotaxis protein [Carboxydothermus islandicus]GAV26346.1 methyl-accepting chemotaxis protein [Carboxydothermus islandicus]